MLEVSGRDGNLTVQAYLGYMATCKQEFRIKVPHDNRIYESIYDFIPAELTPGVLIAHIVVFRGEPNLLVSRVVDVNRELGATTTTRQFLYKSVRSIPILHDGDNRRLDELPIRDFTLMVEDVTCILDEVERKV